MEQEFARQMLEPETIFSQLGGMGVGGMAKRGTVKLMRRKYLEEIKSREGSREQVRLGPNRIKHKQHLPCHKTPRYMLIEAFT